MNHSSDHVGILSAVLAGCIVLALSRCAGAVEISVCPGQTPAFKQPKGTDRLEVRCPGVAAPEFTMVGCVGPSVTRTPPVEVTILATGRRYTIEAKYTLTCARVVPYIQVKQ